MKKHPHQSSNLDTLQAFWNRHSFHDASIDKVSALNKRVVIRLDEYSLVVTGVTAVIGLNNCEFPTSWLYHRITNVPSGFRLDVEAELGDFAITGSDVRLIRNEDLAVLVPPIDR